MTKKDLVEFLKDYHDKTEILCFTNNQLSDAKIETDYGKIIFYGECLENKVND